MTCLDGASDGVSGRDGLDATGSAVAGRGGIAIFFDSARGERRATEIGEKNKERKLTPVGRTMWHV